MSVTTSKVVIIGSLKAYPLSCRNFSSSDAVNECISPKRGKNLGEIPSTKASATAPRAFSPGNSGTGHSTGHTQIFTGDFTVEIVDLFQQNLFQ